MDKMIITHSAGQLWKDCPTRYKRRHVDHLVLAAMEYTPHLFYGTAFHTILERYHFDDFDVDACVDYMVNEISLRNEDHKAHLIASFLAYAEKEKKLPQWDEFVFSEKEFRQPIIHQGTGEAHPDFIQGGKVDGVVRIGEQFFLLEHKTAARPDEHYQRRISIDRQIHQYSIFVAKELGIEIEGILYNVIPKELRWSRKGRKSNGPLEGFKDYTARLKTRYMDKEFLRFYVSLSPTTLADVAQECWTIADGVTQMMRNNSWYKNTKRCFDYGRRCPYWELCETGDRPDVMSLYTTKDPHEELSIV